MGSRYHDRRKPKAAKAKAKVETPQSESPPIADLEVKMEAATIFALAFEGAGGLTRLIDFMKTNNANYGAVLAHYAKTITMSTVSTVNVQQVETDESARAALVANITGLLSARQAEQRERAAAAGITLLDGETYTAALERILAQRDGTVFRDGHVATISDNVGGKQVVRDGRVIEHQPQADTPNAEPASRAEPELPTAAPSPRPRLVPTPRELTPAEAKAKAMEPQRQPVSNEPSTTQQFLEWGGSGGSNRISRKDWGPV